MNVQGDSLAEIINVTWLIPNGLTNVPNPPVP
jgi:hypothetical protein